MTDKIHITVPCDMKFIHLVGDALESYLRLKLLPGKVLSEDETLKSCRLMMYELYSNAVRHSPGSKVDIIIYFKLNYLAIDIETNGEEFIVRPKDKPGLEIRFPYPDSVLGTNFIVYRDKDEVVNCHVLSDSCLEFSKQKTGGGVTEELEIPDHFGLLLLTSLTNDVKYFRTKSGKNIFSVRKHFPKEAVN
ncbi:MAG: hypothetical protein HUU54_08860 [Ignavibacteriaceae bacterium]|nr:hypothetical protein [Ignavibacteriaceae bacterium]